MARYVGSRTQSRGGRVLEESFLQKKKKGSHHLRVENEQVQGAINYVGDAIDHLRLPNGVIDPVSLREMRKERMV